MTGVRTRLVLVLVTTAACVLGVAATARAAWSDQAQAVGGPVAALVVAPAALTCRVSTIVLVTTARVRWPRATVPTALDYTVTVRENGQTLTPAAVDGDLYVDVTNTLLNLLGGQRATLDVTAVLPGTTWRSTVSTQVVTSGGVGSLSC